MASATAHFDSRRWAMLASLAFALVLAGELSGFTPLDGVVSDALASVSTSFGLILVLSLNIPSLVILAGLFVWSVVRLGWRAVGIGAVGFVVTYAVKGIVSRARPEGMFYEPFGASFPSGHASAAALVAVLSVWLLWARRVSHRKIFSVAIVLFAGLIGFSRLYLRVHWLSDVIGGFLLGAACALWFLPRRPVPGN